MQRQNGSEYFDIKREKNISAWKNLKICSVALLLALAAGWSVSAVVNSAQALTYTRVSCPYNPSDSVHIGQGRAEIGGNAVHIGINSRNWTSRPDLNPLSFSTFFWEDFRKGVSNWGTPEACIASKCNHYHPDCHPINESGEHFQGCVWAGTVIGAHDAAHSENAFAFRVNRINENRYTLTVYHFEAKWGVTEEGYNILIPSSSTDITKTMTRQYNIESRLEWIDTDLHSERCVKAYHSTDRTYWDKCLFCLDESITLSAPTEDFMDWALSTGASYLPTRVFASRPENPLQLHMSSLPLYDNVLPQPPSTVFVYPRYPENVNHYLFQVRVVPEGAGTINQYPNGAWLRQNTEIDLAAIPVAPYWFVGWSLDEGENLIDLRPQVQFTLQANTTLYAVFERDPVLNVAVRPPGAATVYLGDASCKDYCEWQVEEPGMRRLTVEHGTGWNFTGWNVDGQMQYTRDLDVLVKNEVNVTAQLEALDNKQPDDSHRRGSDIGDPIAANSGAYYFSMPLLQLSSAIPIYYTLDYRMDRRGDLHSGLYTPFQSNLGDYLKRVGSHPYDVIIAHLRNGDFPRFTRKDAGWELDGYGTTARYVLIETGSSMTDGYYYLLDPERSLIFLFAKSSSQNTSDDHILVRQQAVLDRHGNYLVYSYDNADAMLPSRIANSDNSAHLSFYYIQNSDNETVLSRIVAHPTGKEVHFHYEYHPQLELWVLAAVTDAAGEQTRFEYDPAGKPWRAVAAQVLPRGNTPYRQNVALLKHEGVESPKVTVQIDAYNNKTRLEWIPSYNSVIEHRPDQYTVEYEHFHRLGELKQVTDTMGNRIEFKQTPQQQVNQITDRTGNTLAADYDPQTGKMTSFTDPGGETIHYQWQTVTQSIRNPFWAEAVSFEFTQLEAIIYPDGTQDAFTWDQRGNGLSYTNRAGVMYRYEWNEYGSMTRVINPTGGELVLKYLPPGFFKLYQSVDSHGNLIEYHSDGSGKLTRMVYFRNDEQTEGDEVTYAYNARGQVIRVVNRAGETVRYDYDANGNVTQLIDPENNAVRWEYDDMDRVTATIDRLGRKMTYEWDNMNRLKRITDAMGSTTSLGYDSRGWVNRHEYGGRVWRIEYDDEGLPVKMISPRGRATQMAYDRQGRPMAITNPLQETIRYKRNSNGYIVSEIDAMGRATRFRRDAQGRLTRVELPGGEIAEYAYTPLGKITAITDLNGNLWTLQYSPMGRLIQITDPLKRTTRYEHDYQGRMTRMVLPDDEVIDIEYSAEGLPLRNRYRSGLQAVKAYDTLGQLRYAANLIETPNQTEAAVSHGEVQHGEVQLERNPEGQITSTSDGNVPFTAEYDNAGHLIRVSYSGDWHVNYIRSSGKNGTGQIERVEDSLTGATVQYDYDEDLRPRQVRLGREQVIRYTWDDADRLIRLQSGSVIDVSYTYDASGLLVSQAGRVPLAVADSEQPPPITLEFDAAAQIRSPGYEYDQRGRLVASPQHRFTWDGASRLIAIESTGDGRRVILGYNGLGQLITRQTREQTIRYHYNHAIRNSPVIAEQDDASGKFLRFYVWTPEGRLLYMIDAENDHRVYYYHFDPIGSTLALTDESGQVVAAWAYDPYGQIVHRQGEIKQPFLFVGAWGVRYEGESLYHMQARYYCAYTGRFISPDPIWPQLDDPLALNPYLYAANNPLIHIDPSGTRWIKNIIKALTSRLKPNASQMTKNTGKDEWINFIPGGAAYVAGEAWYDVAGGLAADLFVAPIADPVQLYAEFWRATDDHTNMPDTRGIWNFNSVYQQWLRYCKGRSVVRRPDHPFFFLVKLEAFMGALYAYGNDSIRVGIDVADWAAEKSYLTGKKTLSLPLGWTYTNLTNWGATLGEYLYDSFTREQENVPFNWGPGGGAGGVLW